MRTFDHAAADLEAFDRELTELGDSIRRDVGQADLRHLRQIERAGRLCGLIGLGTAWIAPNPVSVVLLAQAMMARFFIGHQIGHGSYDGIAGVPGRFTRRHFAQGWRRFVDWLDWWDYEDWLYSHNQLHHANTQSLLDGDVMDSMSLVRYPKWGRLLCLGLAMATWKFSYYAPRLRRDRAHKLAGLVRDGRDGLRGRDIFGLADLAVRTLWVRDYAPYLAIRFVLPALIAIPLGSWAAVSVVANLVLAEFVHNAHAFLCIRPSHCAADIPLFASSFRSRQEFHLQSVLGTVNYRAGGDANAFLHGWQNYQVEHHLWPTATLLQCRLARTRLVDICRRNGVPYREAGVLSRALKMARLFMGLEHQGMIETGRTAGPRAAAGPGS